MGDAGMDDVVVDVVVGVCADDVLGDAAEVGDPGSGAALAVAPFVATDGFAGTASARYS